MVDDAEEVPHARGPEEIGAADMGPQNPNSTFAGGAAGGIEMQGIDVEGAVGRRGEGTHKSPEPAATEAASIHPEVAVPKSPKREADNDLEAGASKRAKEGEAEKEDSQAEQKREPEKDAEGDVVIGDSAPEVVATAAADGEMPVDSATETKKQEDEGGKLAGDKDQALSSGSEGVQGETKG